MLQRHPVLDFSVMITLTALPRRKANPEEADGSSLHSLAAIHRRTHAATPERGKATLSLRGVDSDFRPRSHADMRFSEFAVAYTAI